MVPVALYSSIFLLVSLDSVISNRCGLPRGIGNIGGFPLSCPVTQYHLITYSLWLKVASSSWIILYPGKHLYPSPRRDDTGLYIWEQSCVLVRSIKALMMYALRNGIRNSLTGRSSTCVLVKILHLLFRVWDYFDAVLFKTLRQSTFQRSR